MDAEYAIVPLSSVIAPVLLALAIGLSIHILFVPTRNSIVTALCSVYLLIVAVCYWTSVVRLIAVPGIPRAPEPYSGLGIGVVFLAIYLRNVRTDPKARLYWLILGSGFAVSALAGFAHAFEAASYLYVATIVGVITLAIVTSICSDLRVRRE